MIRVVHSLTLWFALICLSMAGQAAPVRTANGGTKADQHPTLAITVGEPQWLEADGQRFLGIFTKSTTGYSLGAAILLPSLGRTPDWPDVIAPLRKALPKYSWNTLAIALPDPVRGDDGRWQFQPYYTAARARIQAAIKYLQQQGNTNIVLIGHGLGAAAAAVAVSGADPLRVSGLAAISLSAPPGSDAGPYQPSLLESIHIPILDIYGSRDFTAVTATAAARAAAARRGGLTALRSQKLDALKHSPQAREVTTEHNGYLAYRQLEITGADHNFRGAEPTLIRRIRGWLKNQSAAAGMTDATLGSG